MGSFRRGAPLPYRLLAGVLPCSRGWLTAPAKLQGATMSPDAPQVLPTFLDVLDYKPAYQVVALFAPVGLHQRPREEGRSCERAARRLLGWPRAGAVTNAPVRPSLECPTFEEAVAMNGGRLTVAAWRQLRRLAEVDRHVASYWQRTVYEVHPELSFYQLNGDRPLQHSIYVRSGREERRRVLRDRFPAVERILDAEVDEVAPSQLLQAAACLWTARRVVAHAVTRLPEDPEWDGQGLRMEYVR